MINFNIAAETWKNSLSIFQKHLTFLNYSLKNYPVGSNFDRDFKLDKYHQKLLLKKE